MVIPARGGSRSIPRKNLIPLLGIPLIAYSIDTARKLPFVERIIVSTDDHEIESVSLRFGAEVVRRSSETSGDLSRDGDLLLELIENDGLISDQDIILFLRPTHPIRNPEIIARAFHYYLSKLPYYDSLRSMKLNNEIVFKSWGIDATGMGVPAFNPELTSIADPCNAPRQILPKTYYQDGYVDICLVSVVRQHGNTCGDRVLPFIINDFSQDIDHFEDLELINVFLNENALPVWFSLPRPVL